MKLKLEINIQLHDISFPLCVDFNPPLENHPIHERGTSPDGNE